MMQEFKRETRIINCKHEELIRLLGLESIPAPYHYRLKGVAMLHDKIVQFEVERTL
jgi:hypothetical protein